MKALGAALSMSLVCACTAPGVVDRTQAPIVGGVDDPGDPAVVEILVQGEGECTGTVVSPHVVLTAAHCVLGVPPGTTFAVFTGQDDARRDQGEVVDAAAAHVHPQYDLITDEGDMAVLILVRPLAIAPVAYARTPLANTLIGQPVRMIGYGDNTVQEPTQGFGKRRQATSPLISFDMEWVVVGDRQFNQCFGDSGGPALMMIAGVETIVGVDSWSDSDDCDVENYNTRVDTYSAFIDQHVAANDPPIADAGVAEDAEALMDAAMPKVDAGEAADSASDAGVEDSGAAPAPIAPDAGIMIRDDVAAFDDEEGGATGGCACVARRSTSRSRAFAFAFAVALLFGYARRRR